MATSIQFDGEELRPLIREVTSEVLAEQDRLRNAMADKLAFSEEEAGRLLSLNPHQLRDERKRGRIGHSRIVGNGVRYTARDIQCYLARKRFEAED